jgi:hypothetical protein
VNDALDTLKHRIEGGLTGYSVTKVIQLLNHPRELGLHGSEWGDYQPYCGWGRLAWGPFTEAFQTVLRLPQLNPPACRHIVRAARAGKTPGLSGAGLREVIALLSRYAEALDEDQTRTTKCQRGLTSGGEHPD